MDVNGLEHCVLILSDFPEAWIFRYKNTTSTAGGSQIQLPGSHFEAQSCKKIHGGNCSSGAVEVDTWHQCTPLRLWKWRWPWCFLNNLVYDGKWQIHVVHSFASYSFQILKKNNLSWWFWGRKPTAWGLAVETLWSLLGQKDPASPTNTWGSVKGGQCQGKVTWLEMLWLWHKKGTVSASFCLFKVFMYVHSWMFSRCMEKYNNPLWTSHVSYPTTDFIAKPEEFRPATTAPGSEGSRWGTWMMRYPQWCTWQLNEIEWGLSNRFVDLNIESNRFEIWDGLRLVEA